MPPRPPEGDNSGDATHQIRGRPPAGAPGHRRRNAAARVAHRANRGGSIFYIKNNSPEALTAYLIELVDYPGSSYSFWQDETVAEPIPPHGEKRIQVANMTVGAVPDYVKMQAALYAGGASAGIPEKIAQLLDRRRVMLETIRQLIGRHRKGAGGEHAEIRSWSPPSNNGRTPCSPRARAIAPPRPPSIRLPPER